MGSIIGVSTETVPSLVKGNDILHQTPGSWAEAQNISKQITNKISNKTGLTGATGTDRVPQF